MVMRAQTIPEKFLRTGVLVVFLVAGLGAGAELLLIGHHEDWQQWVPLVLLGVGILAAVWTLISRDGPSAAFMQVLGMVYVGAGLLGVFFHLTGNREFELEMYPTLDGFDLLAESFTGATPALAPGVMVQLGLLALLYAFRHPSK